ncbi:TonB-dependent receptor [Maribacter algicola]|uniref:TonB-dependent receptor n=1 Tax=Maribacter algicola TaxID=2498892 RepID=A0A426RLH9_9FLAO|nr:TonB-dependent receptor plug domain-containing protein [Maribacter algicola]RRQ49794.1 TonB-dependent receptor [Maribacter algicola]
MRKDSLSYIALVVFFLGTFSSYGQGNQEKELLKEVLETLSERYQVQFNYESDILDNVFVERLSPNSSLGKHLQAYQLQTGLRFARVGSSIYTITKPYTICGYLRDVLYREPLEGATIMTSTERVVSKADGSFQITVSAPDEIVEIRFLGFVTLTPKAETFATGTCPIIEMNEEITQIDPVVLEGYLVRGIDRKGDGSTAINFSSFTALPGLIETDVLQAVQSLPGVVSVDETVSNINIRGGSHDQNLILWDGIKMYQSGHFFGLISSFNPQITKEVKVVTNGTDASYTDGVSGSIHMTTDSHLQEQFKGSLGLNFISADVFADIPVGERSSLQLAARRSLNDVFNTSIYDTYFNRVIQQTEIEDNEENVVNSNQEFNFYDTSIRWLYHPTEKDRIRLNFIVFGNNLDFDETSSVNQESVTRGSGLVQNSVAVGLGYERTWNDTFSTTIDAYNTDYKLQGINSDVLQGQRFLQVNTVSETGIRLKGAYRWNNFMGTMGYQAIESEVINENDIDIPRFLRRDSEVLLEHAVFLQGRYRNNNGGFTFNPGVRLNYNGKFDEFLVEPRISLRKKLGNNFHLEALGELKHQNVSQIVNFQNDFLGVERRRWQLTDNDSIPILRSKQGSLGLQFAKAGWLVDATGYVKEVEGITTQSQSFTTKYEFRKEQGSYDVLGLDMLIRKQVSNFSSWLSYSYMVNNYNFENLEESRFPSNFDNTHSVTFGTTYSNDFLDFSAGINYRTGKPTSVPVLNNEVVDGDINFDDANNTRLPDYLRIDMSAIYKIKLIHGLNSKIGASLWNVLNKENAINDYYRLGLDNSPNQITRFALGTTLNVMVRLNF